MLLSSPALVSLQQEWPRGGLLPGTTVSLSAQVWKDELMTACSFRQEGVGKQLEGEDKPLQVQTIPFDSYG